MEIRRINKEESDCVITLFDNYRIFYEQKSDILLAKKFIQERLDKNESVIFVAFAENQIPVGFTQLYPTYSSVRTVKNWILNDLYVENTHRKQGIGEDLIKKAMQFAKENDAVFVELSTATNNFTAQKLYESIGFEKQKPDEDFFTYRIKWVFKKTKIHSKRDN